MNLKEFVRSFVCPNTLIRLWKPIERGHEMLISPLGKQVAMEWELLKEESWQYKYKDCKVIGVTDIVCDICFEAVNIVIEID